MVLSSVLIVASCGGTASPSPTPLTVVPSESAAGNASLIPIMSAAPSPVATSGEPRPSPTASASPTDSADHFGLSNARLDVPARPSGFESCAQGPRTTFANGRAGEMTVIGMAVEADVDHDGDVDVVAGIDCSPGEGFYRQLVAFHRRADGTFTTIGLVAQPIDSANEDDIQNVYGVTFTAAGEMRVEVGDHHTRATEGGEFLIGVRQVRTYDWNGTEFVQTTGPTSFVVPPGTVDLSVAASPMTYTKPIKGKRNGTLTVTIRNDGPAAVSNVSVLLAMSGGPTAATCAEPVGTSAITCPIARLEPGTTTTVTFHQTISGADPPESADDNAFVQVRVDDRSYLVIWSVTLVHQ
jgi:hypothetical protein